jgi:hypothetical protein
MGNHTIAEQMFRYDPRAMLYAPLRMVIWEDGEGRAWFTVDRRARSSAASTSRGVSAVGVELDRKLAGLLEALGVEVPMALFAS